MTNKSSEGGQTATFIQFNPVLDWAYKFNEGDQQALQSIAVLFRGITYTHITTLYFGYKAGENHQF